MSDDKKTQIGTPAPSVAPRTGPPSSAAMATAVSPMPTPAPVAPAPTTPAPGASPTGVGVAGWQEPTHQGAPTPTQAIPSYQPPADPLIGQVLAGRYLIQKKLGEGGMGSVYLAQHTVLEKAVALKVLHGEFARKPDLVERFMQEAKAASRIRHENVIDISDFGSTPDGLVFFAMELLNGHDLHEEIARARLAKVRLPWERSRPIFLQVCAALSAAHSHGIVHRDLKPENIYLVEWLGHKDFVKLLDFGIAKLTEVSEGDRKLTRTGMLFGTPEYMSPEQARGENVDHRVDVYAMGCILYQLCTGKVPFEAENFMGILSLHLTESPPPIDPSVFDEIGAPREVGAIIMRALAKSRDERWQTVDDMANAIRALHGEAAQPVHEPRVQRVSSAAPGQRQRTQWTGHLQIPTEDDAPPPPRKAVWPWIVGGMLIVGGVAGALVVTMGGKGDKAGAGSQPIAGADVLDAAPAEPALPDRVTVRLDSDPHGAEIYDVTAKEVVGQTPFEFSLPGSHEPRRFTFRLAGHGGKMIELLPVEDVAFTVTLVALEGAGAPVAVAPDIEVVPQKARPGGRIRDPRATAAVSRPTGDGPATNPDGPVTQPDGSGSSKPVRTGSGSSKPIRTGSGSGSSKPVVKPDGGSGSGSAKPAGGTGSSKPPPEDDEPIIKIKDPFANQGGGGGGGDGDGAGAGSGAP